MLVLIRNLSGKSLGRGIGPFCGGAQKMITMRLIDIRVDDFWNQFFQKCWDGFLDSENELNNQQAFYI